MENRNESLETGKIKDSWEKKGLVCLSIILKKFGGSREKR